MVDSTTPRPSAGRLAAPAAPCRKGPVPPGLFPSATQRLTSTIRTQAGSRGRGINHLVDVEPAGDAEDDVEHDAQHERGDAEPEADVGHLRRLTALGGLVAADDA